LLPGGAAKAQRRSGGLGFGTENEGPNPFLLVRPGRWLEKPGSQGGNQPRRGRK